MDIKMMTQATVMLFTMVAFAQIKIHHSMPSIALSGTDLWDIQESDTPSHVRPIRLYSKQGHYVAITPDGVVTATRNESSEDAILEMHSYSVKMKRIKRRGSNWWLSIDKRGRIRTRERKRKDTIFHEHDDGLWLWYENKHGYVLAFRKNLQPKHNITKEAALKKEKNKYSKFLIFKVPQNLQVYNKAVGKRRRRR